MLPLASRGPRRADFANLNTPCATTKFLPSSLREGLLLALYGILPCRELIRFITGKLVFRHILINEPEAISIVLFTDWAIKTLNHRASLERAHALWCTVIFVTA